MAIISKTEQAVSLWKSGNIKEALKIFKTFKIGISKDDKRTIELAYEMLTGNESFYKSLGIDKTEVSNKAKVIIETNYNIW